MAFPDDDISFLIQNNFKVALLGAAGGIGQPLGLLLKQNPLISQLALYDVDSSVPGVAVDLSHINTRPYTEGFKGDQQLYCSLIGSHIVVITAGLPRKPGMSRKDLFKTNAQIMFELTCKVARYCPCAIIAIVTNPVNTVVPIASEVMIRSGVYDPCKIFGVTTLDLVRAATFVSQLNCSNPTCQYVPVIGGHSGTTIIPLLSQSQPPLFLADTVRDQLTKKIQGAGAEVVTAKGGAGSATLSTAFSVARFTDSILRGLSGEPNVVECSYVRSDVTEAQYFSTPLVLGRNGIEKNLGYGHVSSYEKLLIDRAIPALQNSIKVGVDFVDQQCSAK